MMSKSTEAQQGEQRASAIKAAVTAIANRRWIDAVLCLQALMDEDPSVPPSVRNLLERASDGQKIAESMAKNSQIYKALADPEKIIWPYCADIKIKIVKRWELSLRPGDILEGDWDKESKPLDKTIKYRSVKQRYSYGMPWHETELFTRTYVKRLARGDSVRGTSSISELQQQYEQIVDPLYQSLRDKGFVVTFDRFGFADNLPHVHIGRDGELIYGSKGNHRLAMARLLSLKQFPCHVRARHHQWQELREKIYELGPEDCWSQVPRIYATHPDLADLLMRRPPSETVVETSSNSPRYY